MKKITNDEFNNLPIVDGVRQCPGGTDYSEVENIERSTIGEWSTIGKLSTIGEGSTIGKLSTIGEGSTIGEWSTIGEGLIFAGIKCIYFKSFLLYKYHTNLIIDIDYNIHVEMGCFLRSREEWDNDFWNNPAEFPDNGSFESTLRKMAYDYSINVGELNLKELESKRYA